MASMGALGALARRGVATRGAASAAVAAVGGARRAALRPAGRAQRRWLSDKKPGAVQEAAEGAPPPTTITFQQGAKAATTGTVWIGIAAVVGVCGFYIARELMPTSMSPNTVFNNAFALLRDHPEVQSRLGENIKGYGGDYNRKKEGRRNFVDHDTYKDLDGKKRIRVKFNMEGSRGKATIYAEVAEDTPTGEFSYIIIEQHHGGRTEAVALLDNRPHYTRGELQEKVVNRLNDNKAALYGLTNCPWTQRQLLELGEFSERLTVVMCDKEENKARCEKANLKGYPSWELQGDIVPSFQRLEDLQNICLHLN